MQGFAFLLAIAFAPSVAEAALIGPAADAEQPRNKSSSWWLKAGEYRQENGKHASAGIAYANALDTLPVKRKRSNVGARAAMLSADAYWLAFEADEDPAHLQSAIKVLERWIKITGPSSRATLLPLVERMAARYRAIHQPLQKLNTALAQGNLEEAAKHQTTLAEAMAIQDRPWPVGARITIRFAKAHIDSYDQSAVEVEQIKPNQPTLERAKKALEQWQAKKPDDDDSPEAPIVAQLILDIESRLEAGNTQVSDAILAAQQREAAAAAAQEQERLRQEELKAQQETEQADTQAQQAKKKRRVSIALLSTGVVAVAAGAGLMGEALAYRSSAQGTLDDERTEANTLEQMHGDSYDQEGFERAASEYSDQVRRRNLAMIGAGAALAGTGLALGITGAVILAKNRRKNDGRNEQVQLSPSISRSHAGLSLFARF